MGPHGWTVGVDFGGTNIKCGLINRQGSVVRSLVLSSQRFGPPHAFIEGVAGAIETLVPSRGQQAHRLCGVGIGAPGLVDAARGFVYSLVNVNGWRHIPLATRLARRVRVPVFVDNDVNLVALGEQRFGAGRGVRHLICLTLGTGVGGGLVLGGALYRGATGSAGEVGHMVVNPRGRRCACGARGCLEAHVGTAAIVSLGRRALRHGSQVLNRLAHQASGSLTPALIAEAARCGDPAARHIWVEIGRWLGVGLANLANLFNPERIVIGGGVANAWRWFYPTLITTLRAQAMDVPGRTVRVVRAQLGDRAGMLGASVLVWSKLKPNARGVA